MAKNQTKPIKIASWGQDFYSLGIFCEKTNTTAYAKRNIKALRHKTDEARLFIAGVDHALEASFKEVAFEANHLRSKGKDKFDAFITCQAGRDVCSQLIEAIHDARDWETDEQKRVAEELLCLRNTSVAPPMPSDDQ